MAATAVGETERRTNVRWLLIAWLFGISAIAYLDRVNISIAGQATKNEFHLDNIQLGWVFSAFVLGYALLQASAGRIVDRVGARLVLTLGVIWWAVFTALITFLSPTLPGLIIVLIAIRFLLGVGEAVMYPASSSCLCIGGWSGRTIFVAKFFLVCELRHRRKCSRLSLWFYEYGLSARRRNQFFSNASDCRKVRMDHFVCRRRSADSCGKRGMASCGSQPLTNQNGTAVDC